MSNFLPDRNDRFPNDAALRASQQLYYGSEMSATPSEAPKIEKRLAEIRQRCEAATPGPWLGDIAENPSWRGLAHWQIETPEGGIIAQFTEGADQKFCSYARADIPFLLQENARLTAAVDAVRDYAKECDGVNARGRGRGHGLMLTRMIWKILDAAHDKGGTAE